MAYQSGNPDHESMAGEVDRLLQQLTPSHVDPVPSTRSFSRSAPDPDPEREPDPTYAPTAQPTPLGVWGRAILGVILAGALTQWPYLYCGVPLGFYLVGSALVVVVGVWAGYGSWKLRLGAVHVIAILLLFAGAALAAHQVLPRLGYAPAPVAWGCPG